MTVINISLISRRVILLLCIAVLLKSYYYRNRGSHVFLCFIDFSEALDRVNYRTLFSQLLDDGIEQCFVKLLAFYGILTRRSVCLGRIPCQGIF